MADSLYYGPERPSGNGYLRVDSPDNLQVGDVADLLSYFDDSYNRLSLYNRLLEAFRYGSFDNDLARYIERERFNNPIGFLYAEALPKLWGIHIPVNAELTPEDLAKA